MFGWPNIPEVEAEIIAWYDAKSVDEAEAIVRRLNKAALDNVVYAPLGSYPAQHACRASSGAQSQRFTAGEWHH